MNYTATSSATFTALAGIPPPDSDNHRWYLCIETNGLLWTCKETTKDGALSYMGQNRSIAVPIRQWHPRFMDQSILKSSIQPKVQIVQEFKKTDQ